SFCQHVVTTHEPLVISDARIDPVFKENLAIRDLGVVAYLGIPLKLEHGEILGSFCVIDSQPRIWTNEEIATLETLSSCVMTELELRNEIINAKNLNRQLDDLNQQLNEKVAELETANSELESFSYTVSHDIRAPLKRIQMLCTLLREEGKLTGENEEYLQAILSSATGANDVLEGLLFLCGVSKRPINREKLDLTALAKAIFSELQRREPTRRAQFQIQPNLVVYADPYLMRIALENLLGNAWKFTSKREETIIEVGTMDSTSDIIFVRDNGAGFNMEHADKLFRTFTRLHRQDEFEGTGIGLGTVRKIIHRHGGRIWAEGEVDRGATFYFQISGAHTPDSPANSAPGSIS
ncbi:MAG: ATP-binding protein, partial [Limisphaerales bacterium]